MLQFFKSALGYNDNVAPESEDLYETAQFQRTELTNMTDSFF